MDDSATSSKPTADEPIDERERRLRLLELHPPLPTGIRISLLIAGWVMLLLGFAGLFLPFLQGILFLIMGSALLSLVSKTMLLALRSVFGRWPRGWARLLRLRLRIHRWLTRGGDDQDETGGSGDLSPEPRSPGPLPPPMAPG